MDKCRKEFEQWFKTTQYFCNYFTDSDLNLNHRNEYENEIINGAWLTWQHQQAKVEELQKWKDKIIRAIDWHIEDCEMTLWTNKDDYYTNGFEDALLLIKKYLKEKDVEQSIKGEVWVIKR